MLGSTVPTIGGLPNGFKNGDAWGCECIQIYVTLSRTWEVKELTEEEVRAFKEAWQKSAVKQVIAHVPYIVNIASPDPIVRRKARKRLEIEYSRCDRFGVPILVLHPGGFKTSSREEGLQRVIKTLNRMHRKFPKPATRILLETMAGQGTMMDGGAI